MKQIVNSRADRSSPTIQVFGERYLVILRDMTCRQPNLSGHCVIILRGIMEVEPQEDVDLVFDDLIDDDALAAIGSTTDPHDILEGLLESDNNHLIDEDVDDAERIVEDNLSKTHRELNEKMNTLAQNLAKMIDKAATKEGKQEVDDDMDVEITGQTPAGTSEKTRIFVGGVTVVRQPRDPAKKEKEEIAKQFWSRYLNGYRSPSPTKKNNKQKATLLGKRKEKTPTPPPTPPPVVEEQQPMEEVEEVEQELLKRLRPPPTEEPFHPTIWRHYKKVTFKQDSPEAPVRYSTMPRLLSQIDL